MLEGREAPVQTDGALGAQAPGPEERATAPGPAVDSPASSPRAGGGTSPLPQGCSCPSCTRGLSGALFGRLHRRRQLARPDDTGRRRWAPHVSRARQGTFAVSEIAVLRHR